MEHRGRKYTDIDVIQALTESRTDKEASEKLGCSTTYMSQLKRRPGVAVGINADKNNIDAFSYILREGLQQEYKATLKGERIQPLFTKLYLDCILNKDALYQHFLNECDYKEYKDKLNYILQ